jgi:hypothetical protein
VNRAKTVAMKKENEKGIGTRPTPAALSSTLDPRPLAPGISRAHRNSKPPAKNKNYPNKPILHFNLALSINALRRIQSVS